MPRARNKRVVKEARQGMRAIDTLLKQLENTTFRERNIGKKLKQTNQTESKLERQLRRRLAKADVIF